MRPRFVVEFWPHGWLICGAKGEAGVPLSALNECGKLFPRTAVVDLAIPHHFRSGGRREVVMAVVDAGSKQNAWRAEIAASIAHLPPLDRWWMGLDVGASSAAMFGVLVGSPRLATAARDLGRGATPKDGDDFGRCVRLLELFPAWRDRLGEVAAAYPDTKWPALVARWAEVEQAADKTAALRSILSP